jgi:hypothetical protein
MSHKPTPKPKPGKECACPKAIQIQFFSPTLRYFIATHNRHKTNSQKQLKPLLDKA